jgi:hypothetical protein
MNKNKALKKKLVFNKETIANLNGSSMNHVIGGVLPTTAPCGSDNCLTHNHPNCMVFGTEDPTCPQTCPECPSGEPGCPPVDTDWETCPIGCAVI